MLKKFLFKCIFTVTLILCIVLYANFYFKNSDSEFLLSISQSYMGNKFNYTENFFNLSNSRNHTKKNKTHSKKKFNRLYKSLTDLDCYRILSNDKKYIETKAQYRISYIDSDKLVTDCESIKQRNYFPTKPASTIEAKFPLAFARNVYKDYLFLEMELSAEYAPQNFYCYTVDQKANELFKRRIRNWSKCFPNVIVADKEFDTNSEGRNINYALMECFNLLFDYEWNYVFTLNNYDVIMRTNYELVNVLRLFNGANDIMIHTPNMDRINNSIDWSFFGLELFRDSAKNKYPDGTSPQMKWAKGNFQSTVSKKMVDFLLNELNLTKFLTGLEGHFAVDELFLPTLQATDELNAPGGFSHTCLDKNIEVHHITRYDIWSYANHAYTCRSNIWRHSLCIFGIEDLHRLTQLPHFFANKMIPELDFGALVCWYEYMHYRSHVNRHRHFLPDYYLSMPHIRYHYERRRSEFDRDSFDCNFKFRNCVVDLKCL